MLRSLFSGFGSDAYNAISQENDLKNNKNDVEKLGNIKKPLLYNKHLFNKIPNVSYNILEFAKLGNRRSTSIW